MFDLIVDVLFHTGFLKANESHNLRLVNKSCGEIVKKHLKKSKFRRIQEVVDKDGLYLNSYENFLFVKSIGYTVYSVTITSIVKHKGNLELLSYLICKCKIQIPESAFIEAWKLQNNELFGYLWDKCYDHRTKQNVMEWIEELSTFQKKKQQQQFQTVFYSANKLSLNNTNI